ncbi:MAG TPA: NUDIX hydrolase [Yinghuangia sp.]|uniref:NUDIX hydrolase n=1 Tax=Yinghuangia sp. YIM S10712 TaxID=3436930 RepID=UPI002BC0703C|nr:NUDIX hydrolase [Yinghuangia sp.]
MDAFDAQAESTGKPAGRSLPVSVKGVVFDDRDRVLLLRNPRREFELPGGRPEPGESYQQCVVREIEEEAGWEVVAGPWLDEWVYEPLPGRRVRIVTYGCHLAAGSGAVRLSDEHSDGGLFAVAELPGLPLPGGYARSVAAWAGHPARTRPDTAS